MDIPVINVPIEIVWGDVATWVTGVTSIALFIIAFYQIKIERKARKQAAAERISAEQQYQAERIAGWIVVESIDEKGMPIIWIAISNQSLQPIYHLVIHGLVISNDGSVPIIKPNPDYQARIAVVPPGVGYVGLHLDYHGMFKRPGFEIAFQDSGNRYWVRKHNAELKQIDESPIDYYNIMMPTGWDSLIDEIPKASFIR